MSMSESLPPDLSKSPKVSPHTSVFVEGVRLRLFGLVSCVCLLLLCFGVVFFVFCLFVLFVVVVFFVVFCQHNIFQNPWGVGVAFCFICLFCVCFVCLFILFCFCFVFFV